MDSMVYLHIGMNKTGTSAIQHCLSKNYAQLRKNNILYPKAGRPSDAHYDLAGCFDFMFGKSNKKKDCREKIGKNLLKEISSSSPQKIIISSESFVNPKPRIAPLKRFLDSDQVKVIVYLRRHDKWFESVYAQAIKTVSNPRWGRRIQSYIRNIYRSKEGGMWYGNYKNLVDRWADEFGKDNIIVRPYEKGHLRNGVVEDFFEAIDESDLLKSLKYSDRRLNISPSDDALQLIDIFQRIDVSSKVRAQLISHAMNLTDDSKSRGFLSPVERLDIINDFHADYDYIARTYLNRDDGRLFYEPLPDLDEDWEPKKLLSPMRAVEEALRVFGKS